MWSLRRCGPLLDDRTLTRRICAFLGELPGWDWHEDDGTDYEYPADAVAIFYGALGAKPDAAVGVRVYSRTEERGEHLSWRRVQLRVRGAPDDVEGADRLAEDAFQRLQGASRVAGISGISHQSMTPLGADGNRREERTENYIIILDNQEALT